MSDQQLYAGDSNYPGEATSYKKDLEKQAVDIGWSLSEEVNRLRIRAGLPKWITKNSYSRMMIWEEGAPSPWLTIGMEQTPTGEIVGWAAKLLDHPLLYKPGRHD